jgi:hypothetical protein
MDLGKITGKTLNLPESTTLYIVDFINKKVLLEANIENSTYDPEVWAKIQTAQEEQASIYKDAKLKQKKTA